MKIVVIDDDKIYLLLLKKMLRELDHKVVTFSNVKKSLKYLNKNKIDFVICDFVLKDSYGIEVFEKYKKSPFLLISSIDLEFKNVDFLKKPFSFNELKHAIEKKTLTSM